MGCIFLVVLFLVPNFTFASKYSFNFDYEGIVQPCPHEVDRSFSKWFDMSALISEFGNDDELNVHGDILIVYDFKPGDIIDIDIGVKKMVRGDYRVPILDARRNDFCLTMFSPDEIWWVFMGSFEERTRKCPPALGEYYRLNFTTRDVKVTLPDPNFAGAYQATVRMSLKRSQEHICFTIPLHVYKT